VRPDTHFDSSFPGRRRHRRWYAVAFLGAWGLLVGLHLHGFSITNWRTHIDGSRHREVLLGRAREIRSDDSAAVLPLVLSQCAHRPPFPVHNTLIGDGRCNTVIGYALPVLDVVTLFRPQLWGYFVSADFGLAFNWWFYVFGVLLVLFLLLMQITRGDAWVSACGTAIALYAPFFQYWSLNCAPSVIFAGCLVLSGLLLWRANTLRRRIVAAAALSWSASAFLLTFSFLPYQVTLGYLVLVLLPALVVQAGTVRPRIGRAVRTAAFVLALGAAGALLTYVLAQNADVVRAVRESAYPGARLVAGGDSSWGRLLRGNFITLLRPEHWGALGNICEGGAFFLFFPVVVPALALERVRARCRPTAIQIALLAYLAFLLVWSLVGFPEWLAAWTGMGRVPTRRALLGIGLADLALVAVYASARGRDRSAARAGDCSLWVAGLVWLVLLWLGGVSLRRLLPHHDVRLLLGGGLITAALGAALVLRPRWVLPVLAGLSLFATVHFNPLVRGGSAYIRDNPLSRKIVELDRSFAQKTGRPGRWVAYGRERYDIHTPNLFRMLGVHSVNGLHPYCQARIWEVLDPGRAHRGAWNRYCHVRFSLPAAPSTVDFQLLQPDLLVVRLHPEHERFRALGVDYLVYSGPAADMAGVRNLEGVFSYAGKHVYLVVPDQDSRSDR